MRKLLYLLPLLAGLAWSQTTPDCQFTLTFTTATVQSPTYFNKSTITGGAASCIAWRITYSTTGTVTAFSLLFEGTNDLAGNSGVYTQGSHPDTTYTPLTAAQSTVNPAVENSQGTIVACCDYYPWVRLNLGTLTGTLPVVTVRAYGYKGTSAALNTGGSPPTGPAGGALAGTYPDPTLADITTQGDTVAGGAAGVHTRIAGNTSTVPKVYTETGDGVNAGIPSWQVLPTVGSLLFYFQNSILASGTYTSGGSQTGSIGQTCTLTAFNGGGTGATATVALTGSNVIAGGTAIVVTAAGTQYTSAPTSATLGNGTATCSGTATLATVLNVPSSNVSGDFPMLTSPYTPKTTLSYPGLATGTDTLQNWVTNPNIPNLSFIPAGIYDCHVHARRTGGGTVNLFCEFWEVNAAGADLNLIGVTENSNPLTGAEVEYEMFFVDPNVFTFVGTTSRVVARLRATVSGSAPTVDVFAGGTADSHMALPSNTIDATNFVPYTGATKNIDLGSFSYTNTAGANFRAFGGSFSNGSTPLVAGATATSYFTVPYACTIAAWNITISPADTATIDIWRNPTGTAIPTSGQSITASAVPAIAANTALHSTTMTGWCGTGTCTIAQNDIIGINLKAVGGTATYANLVVQCNQ